MQLTWKALKFVKGRHTPKTFSFVKSVLAYIAITIPDLDDPFQRMRLYQLSGVAALHNNVCDPCLHCAYSAAAGYSLNCCLCVVRALHV